MTNVPHPAAVARHGAYNASADTGRPDPASRAARPARERLTGKALRAALIRAGVLIPAPVPGALHFPRFARELPVLELDAAGRYEADADIAGRRPPPQFDLFPDIGRRGPR